MHIQVGKQKRTLPDNPPLQKESTKRLNWPRSRRLGEKKPSVLLRSRSRETVRFARNLGASDAGDDDVLDGAFES